MTLNKNKLKLVEINEGRDHSQLPEEDAYQSFKRNEEINTSLIDEYMRHHRFKTQNLRGYQRELFQTATDTIMDNWYFPVNGCPWQADYFTQKHYLCPKGELHHERDIKNVCSPSTRMHRARWLYTLAEQTAAVRELEWQFNTATTWGVITAELLRGTYETMKTHNPNSLITHKQIMGNNEREGDLCIVNRSRAARTTLVGLMEKNVYHKDKNKYGTIGGMHLKELSGPVTLDNPRQLPYYVRVNGRLSFCLKMIIKVGVYIASSMYVNKDGWDTDLGYWEETLKIDRKIIDVALAKLNGANQGKTWHWM